MGWIFTNICKFRILALIKRDKVIPWHIAECFEDAFVKMGNVNVVQNAPVFLPQNDPDLITRGQGLQAAIGNYQLEQKTFGLTDSHQRLVDIVNLPPMVSECYKLSILSIQNSNDIYFYGHVLH